MQLGRSTIEEATCGFINRMTSKTPGGSRRYKVCYHVATIAQFAGGTGRPSRLCQEGRRKLTESAKGFPKDSAWHSPKGPFREALERRALPALRRIPFFV